MNGPLRSVHEPVLGTRLALRVDGSPPSAARAETAVLAVCDRLEDLLSAFRPASAWSQWRDGVLADPPPEVAELLGLAAQWHTASGGAFDPRAGDLRQRWLAGATEASSGAAPAPARTPTVPLPAELPYRLWPDGRVERTGECRGLDLHALAKGWIADRAADAAMAVDGVTAVVVNLGGDLVHRGSGGMTVRIEDPRTPFDNSPPLALVDIASAAVATSSAARRPLVRGGQRAHHTFDARTGEPVAHVLSVTAVAPTCADADALATAATVLAPAAALVLADRQPGCAVMVLDANGRRWTSSRWPTTG